MREFFRKLKQDFPYFIARKMPKWLIYHCHCLLMAEVSTQEFKNKIMCEITGLETRDDNSYVLPFLW